MTYRVIGDNESEKFNEEAKKHSQILQSYEWGEVKSAFGWAPIRILIDGVGCVSILKRKLPLINKCFFYVPRGPSIDFKNQDHVGSFISAIKNEAKKHGAVFLRMDPEILENDYETINILKKVGFNKGKKEIQPRTTFILDLTKSLEEIVSNFEPKFRYNMKLAEKKGILVKEDISEKAVEKFYEIYKETCSRQTFIIHPISYYKKIYNLLIKKGMGTLFIAYNDFIPIAGVFIFAFGKRIWYMYGASSNKSRNLMPNNLLHFHVIKWAKEKGFLEYDLWGIPSNPNENHPLWGVYRFKKGFNAKLVKFIGAYDLPFNKIMYKIFDEGIVIYQSMVRLIKKGTIADSLGE